MGTTFTAVRACSLALLSGAVLQVGGVSAGNGIVIDWRTVRSGETLTTGADAFDTAQLFVALVGPETALSALREEIPPAPETAPFVSSVVAFMPYPHGGRRRSFEAGEFTVMVEPHDDDQAQAAFTERLAALAAQAM